MDLLEATLEPNSAEVRTLGEQIFFTISFGLCGIIGVIGNALVIYVIYRDPGLRISDNLSNFLIMQLAITDLLTSAFCSIPAAITILFDTRIVYGIFCKLQATINLMGMCASWHLLGVITIDRFIAVTKPLHYPQIVTKGRLNAVSTFVWAFSIWAGVVSAFWKPYWTTFEYSLAMCDFDFFGVGTNEGFLWVCFSWSAHFAVPTTYMMPMNGAIVYIARKGKKKGAKSDGCLSCFKSCCTKSSKSEGGGEAKSQPQEDKQATRVLLSMMIITLAFLTLSSPTGAVRFAKIFFPECTAFRDWLPPANQVAQFSASVVNPFVYGFLRKDFKNAFKALLK